MTKPTENELLKIEMDGLKKHGLNVFNPSQLSDSFRNGLRFGWQARAELADKEKAELQAQINELREALEVYASVGIGAQIAEKALTKTAPQCLIQHDNEVIERCAKIADAWEDISCRHKIRALKG